MVKKTLLKVGSLVCVRIGSPCVITKIDPEIIATNTVTGLELKLSYHEITGVCLDEQYVTGYEDLDALVHALSDQVKCSKDLDTVAQQVQDSFGGPIGDDLDHQIAVVVLLIACCFNKEVTVADVIEDVRAGFRV